MARIETVERTLYSFEELSDAAKETARDWWRSCIESDECEDKDDWQTVAGILGIQFSTRAVRLMGGSTRYDPTIYWTLYPDSAAFAGRYTYAKQAPKRIREYAPQDTALHGIADNLQAIQRRNFYRLAADCETGGRDGTTQKVQSFKINSRDYNEYIDCDELESALTDFAHWIARQVSVQSEYLHSEYLHSDENVDDCIAVNEYEFYESGNIA